MTPTAAGLWWAANEHRESALAACQGTMVPVKPPLGWSFLVYMLTRSHTADLTKTVSTLLWGNTECTISHSLDVFIWVKSFSFLLYSLLNVWLCSIVLFQGCVPSHRMYYALCYYTGKSKNRNIIKLENHLDDWLTLPPAYSPHTETYTHTMVQSCTSTHRKQVI